ncbi:hypothetical protein ACQ4LE_010147 [Meloidogyne hapla]
MKCQNHFLNIILIQLFIYFCESNNYETKKENDWACGSKGNEWLAKRVTCSAKKCQINNCCIAHDNCYNDQSGKKKCDDNFCGCLETAAGKIAKCEFDYIAFCNLVKWLGKSAYESAAKDKGKHKEHIKCN